MPTMLPSRDLLKILNKTHAELSDQHSLDRLADYSGWSKYYLHRMFSRALGETPKQFVNRVRLDRAAAELTGSEKPIQEIALEVGFQSHEVFLRAFAKKFACSPSAYRSKTRKTIQPQSRSRHSTLVKSISPCTGLYYTSDKPKRNKKMATSEITRKVLEQTQAIIFLRHAAPHSEFARIFPECIGKVFTHAMAHGLPIAGHPMARYVDTGPGLWGVDFIVPLAEPAPESAVTEEFQAGSLYTGPVAFAEHTGPYDTLPETNAAIQQWIMDNGYEVSCAPWEYYDTDPSEEPDPTKWVTQVYWPINN